MMLLAAAKAGEKETCKRIILSGYPVSEVDKYRKQPLHVAAAEGRLEIVQILLAAHADVKAVDSCGWSPLHYATFGGHFKIVELLIDQGAEVSAVNDQGTSPLHYISGSSYSKNTAFSYLSALQLLLQKGADVNKPNHIGETPLHLAAYSNRNLGVMFLLLKQANINQLTKGSLTPLHLAAMLGHKEVVETLLWWGADVNIKSTQGTCLEIAERHGRKEIVKLLTERRRSASKHTIHEDMSTMISFARWFKQYQEQKEDRIKENEVLYKAINYTRLDVVSKLLPKMQQNVAATTNLNIKVMWMSKKKRQTPLHVAVQRQSDEIVALLLQYQADPNLIDMYGRTPLHLACTGSYKVFELLINSGAYVQATDRQGSTLLHYAVQNQSEDPFECLQVLSSVCETTPEVNTKNLAHETPLYTAAHIGNALACLYLLQLGAKPNIPCKSSMTPLHVACMNGYIDVVEILIRYGADTRKPSDYGTCLEIAERTGNREIISMLVFDKSQTNVSTKGQSKVISALENIISEFHNWQKNGKLKKKTILHAFKRFTMSPNNNLQPVIPSSNIPQTRRLPGWENNVSPVPVDDFLSILSEANNSENGADDQFDITQKLGEGAYGKVYSAQHKNTGFVVAMKKIGVSEEQKELISKEIKLIQKCRHPAIVQYYGCYGSKDGKIITVLLEYCAFGSVLDYFKMIGFSSVTEEELASVLRSVLNGLSYLHANLIVHRDVKGQNILISKDGIPKIADFGMSAQLHSAAYTNSIVGTPLFMAPECLSGNNSSLATDIWSLGITVIQLVDGVPPYADQNFLRAVFLIGNEGPPAVKDPSSRSPEFNDFVSHCLQKQPEERSSAQDLLKHVFVANENQEPLQRLLVKFQAKRRLSAGPNNTLANDNDPNKDKKKLVNFTGSIFESFRFSGPPGAAAAAAAAGTNIMSPSCVASLKLSPNESEALTKKADLAISTRRKKGPREDGMRDEEVIDKRRSILLEVIDEFPLNEDVKEKMYEFIEKVEEEDLALVEKALSEVPTSTAPQYPPPLTPTSPITPSNSPPLTEERPAKATTPKREGRNWGLDFKGKKVESEKKLVEEREKKVIKRSGSSVDKRSFLHSDDKGKRSSESKKSSTDVVVDEKKQASSIKFTTLLEEKKLSSSLDDKKVEKVEKRETLEKKHRSSSSIYEERKSSIEKKSHADDKKKSDKKHKNHDRPFSPREERRSESKKVHSPRDERKNASLDERKTASGRIVEELKPRTTSEDIVKLSSSAYIEGRRAARFQVGERRSTAHILERPSLRDERKLTPHLPERPFLIQDDKKSDDKKLSSSEGKRFASPFTDKKLVTLLPLDEDAPVEKKPTKEKEILEEKKPFNLQEEKVFSSPKSDRHVEEKRHTAPAEERRTSPHFNEERKITHNLEEKKAGSPYVEEKKQKANVGEEKRGRESPYVEERKPKEAPKEKDANQAEEKKIKPSLSEERPEKEDVADKLRRSLTAVEVKDKLKKKQQPQSRALSFNKMHNKPLSNSDVDNIEVEEVDNVADVELQDNIFEEEEVEGLPLGEEVGERGESQRSMDEEFMDPKSFESSFKRNEMRSSSHSTIADMESQIKQIGTFQITVEDEDTDEEEPVDEDSSYAFKKLKDLLIETQCELEKERSKTKELESKVLVLQEELKLAKKENAK